MTRSDKAVSDKTVTHRSATRAVRVGDLVIGGSDSVVIQSMTNTKTADVAATVAQINALEAAGCEMVRVTVNNVEAAEAVAAIKAGISIPLVADIHFDYKLALLAIENGIDKIRINPGNIGSRENVEAVVRACKEHGVPIRIGVNAGSLEKHLLEEFGYPTAEAMVASAKFHVGILEELDFHDIIISLKASNVPLALEAYRLAAETFDYPLHLGITEAGTKFSGSIKSAAGLGGLLSMGIGNTLRVSLSADPVEEIKVAREVLKTFGLMNNAPTLISCPTCGRTEIDLIPIAEEIERYLENVKAPIKVAVMGCIVNGPGEAREADIGLAGGRGVGMLFKHGEPLRRVDESEMLSELKKEIDKLIS
ncbi:MAG: flavodoxin-dependent (E)-4-hydroxy-3-methylbut-2-enyl-diphosphate synthase [Lactobacillales bacterium]|jgi:(E)-4-hydroxy-3-methylbut-2-enyl-diphosphate synthase|nr:flavodoxin-dependent (E)-4-hydroxy-3-methylbut-2-enyl-diphosphate synthase [Lactobacillales bacterium]